VRDEDTRCCNGGQDATGGHPLEGSLRFRAAIAPDSDVLHGSGVLQAKVANRGQGWFFAYLVNGIRGNARNKTWPQSFFKLKNKDFTPEPPRCWQTNLKSVEHFTQPAI
jgi:hypothetical protein